MTSKFWIVMSKERGAAAFPVRHNSERSAFDEAQRLAKQHGGVFFVLEAKGAAARIDVQIDSFLSLAGRKQGRKGHGARTVALLQMAGA